MSRVYFTYFDHRYLAKGLAMIRSLRRHEPGAQVWVLCLSTEAQRILDEFDEPGVKTVALAQLEEGDGALAAAKADGRSTVEYYFTLAPSLALHLLNELPQVEMITYLDGDLWFFGNPDPIYREMGQASILIIPHRFAQSQRHMESHGIYNVGWLTFRNDASGRACLNWWRDRNNEWCFDWVDEVHGRYCDQRYLDYFPEKFTGVHVLEHHGANLAPWNVGATEITKQGNRVCADGDEVLFFHFHGLKRLAQRQFLTFHRNYKAPLEQLVRRELYEPYLLELLAIEREIESRYGVVDNALVRGLDGRKNSMWRRSKAAVKARLAVWQGYAITLPERDSQ